MTLPGNSLTFSMCNLRDKQGGPNVVVYDPLNAHYPLAAYQIVRGANYARGTPVTNCDRVRNWAVNLSVINYG